MHIVRAILDCLFQQPFRNWNEWLGRHGAATHVRAVSRGKKAKIAPKKMEKSA
jgi:hypothetical protein